MELHIWLQPTLDARRTELLAEAEREGLAVAVRRQEEPIHDHFSNPARSPRSPGRRRALVCTSLVCSAERGIELIPDGSQRRALV